MSLITPYLFVGSAKEARNDVFLRSKRVHTIVNCAREVPNFFQQDFQYTRLELDDVPDQDLSRVLESTSRHIIQQMREGKVVFVHCAAGISRSVAIVIYTLMKLHRWNFVKAYRFVKDLHPQSNPNPGFVQQLASYNNPMQREGIPLTVGNSVEESSIDSSFDLIDGPGGSPAIGPPSAYAQDTTIGIRGEDYHPPNSIYTKEGGMAPMADPEQSTVKSGWKQLTFDCPECDLPEYSTGGSSGGLYARIFS